MAFNVVNPPLGAQLVPSLTIGSTVTDSTPSDSGDENGILKNSMKLLWAERVNIDLKLRLRTLEQENCILKDALRELRPDSNANISGTGTNIAPLSQSGQIQKTIDTENLKLTLSNLALNDADQAKEETKTMRTEIQTLHVTNKMLSEKLNLSELKLKESEAQSSTMEDRCALVEDLKGIITNLRFEIEQLRDKNDQLVAKNFQILETVTRDGEGTTLINPKKENNEHELRDLRAKLAAAEAESSRSRQCSATIIDQATLDEERAKNFARFDRLAGENDKLKVTNDELEKQVKQLKWDIGFFITELGFAEMSIRVFSCRHKQLKGIPDGQNATREKDCGVIAADMFEKWEHDKSFLREYNHARRFYLDHHRAHKRANQGRGADAGALKIALLKVDLRRCVKVTYT